MTPPTVETRHVFVSRSLVPPARWSETFPEAQIVRDLPATVPAGTLLWLHNLLPEDIAGRLAPGVKLIVLHDEPSDDKSLMALTAGAVGIANAHAQPEVLRLIAAVVASGGLWVGEALLTRLLRALPGRANGGGSPVQLDGLSERERTVAFKVAHGESNKEIARALDISERTVKAHLTAAFHKLGVRDRLQLAVLLGTPTLPH